MNDWMDGCGTVRAASLLIIRLSLGFGSDTGLVEDYKDPEDYDWRWIPNQGDTVRRRLRTVN